MMALDPRHNRDLLRLSDGTIISKSTGRVVRNGIEEGSSTGCWGNRKIGNPFGDQGASWNDLDRLPLNMDPNERKMVEVGLSPEDIEYARMREAGSRSLVANMSDEQVKLLKKLENGEITRLSRLVPD